MPSIFSRESVALGSIVLPQYKPIIREILFASLGCIWDSFLIAWMWQGSPTRAYFPFCFLRVLNIVFNGMMVYFACALFSSCFLVLAMVGVNFSGRFLLGIVTIAPLIFWFSSRQMSRAVVTPPLVAFVRRFWFVAYPT